MLSGRDQGSTHAWSCLYSLNTCAVLYVNANRKRGFSWIHACASMTRKTWTLCANIESRKLLICMEVTVMMFSGWSAISEHDYHNLTKLSLNEANRFVAAIYPNNTKRTRVGVRDGRASLVPDSKRNFFSR